ncbi:MAG: hypothetical protein WCI50_14855 [Actinomycetes bacterium]|jgi:hypothetical protein
MPEFPSVPGPVPPGADLVVAGPADVVAFLHACGCVGEEPLEVVLGLVLTEALPRAHVVCGAAVRDPLGAPRRPLDALQLADLAAELVVGAVVVASVAADARPPTRTEVRRFVELRHACAYHGVALLDRVVIGARAWWSFRERVHHDAA